MKNHDTYHVMARLDGGWTVMRAGAEKAIRRFSTQREAIEYGKSVSKNNSSGLVVHRRDGRLASRVSYAPKHTAISKNGK